MTQYISCQIHDYIEIACMYGYQVKLKLRNGQVIEGKAMNTHISSDKREYLVISNETIELIQVTKMTILTPNAKFNEIILG